MAWLPFQKTETCPKKGIKDRLSNLKFKSFFPNFYKFYQNAGNASLLRSSELTTVPSEYVAG